MVQPAMRRFCAGVFVILLLSSCGGEDEPGATDPDRDPAEQTTDAPPDDGDGAVACPLTAEQVSEVLGLDMAASAGTCSFAASSTYAEVHYAAVGSEVFSADEPSPVEGVGDSAYRGPSGELYVQSGDGGFSIQVLVAPGGPVDGDTAEEELAREVIESR